MTYVIVVMMYSTGLPILYPFSFLFYFANYWVYKILLLKYYRTTTSFNEDLALNSIRYLRFAMIMHIITAIVMLSNPIIFPVTSEETLKTHKYANSLDYMHFL